MSYKDPTQDFIERTLKIIEQYNEYVPEPEQYEVTLLINCLLGLIALPVQRLKETSQALLIPALTLEDEDLEQWGLPSGAVRCWGNPPKKGEEPYPDYKQGTLHDLMYRMRNGVVHSRFGFPSDGGRIKEVEFKDINCSKKGINCFQMVISVTDLRQFVTNVAKRLLANAKNANTNSSDG